MLKVPEWHSTLDAAILECGCHLRCVARSPLHILCELAHSDTVHLFGSTYGIHHSDSLRARRGDKRRRIAGDTARQQSRGTDAGANLRSILQGANETNEALNCNHYKKHKSIAMSRAAISGASLSSLNCTKLAAGSCHNILQQSAVPCQR